MIDVVGMSPQDEPLGSRSGARLLCKPLTYKRLFYATNRLPQSAHGVKWSSVAVLGTAEPSKIVLRGRHPRRATD
jgi:hypothetical protein